MRALCFSAALLLGAFVTLLSQSPKVLMPEDLFRRNIGSREQLNKQFPPHKIAGNLYYVGNGEPWIVLPGYSGGQHSD